MDSFDWRSAAHDAEEKGMPMNMYFKIMEDLGVENLGELNDLPLQEQIVRIGQVLFGLGAEIALLQQRIAILES